MKTKLLLILTSILFTACSETPKETSKTVVTATQSKPETVKEKEIIVPEKEVIVLKTKVQNTPIAKPSTQSGSSLYTAKCASCHGKDAKKSALNASQAIAGWDSSKTQGALKGYQDGSYGKKMKNIMQGQTKPLSDADIKLLSDYISIL